MRRFFLLASYFTFTPLLILICIIYFFFLSYNYNSRNALFSQDSNSVAFAALPSKENVLGDSIVFKDARVEMLRQFFARYKSPLEPFASNVVEEADNHGLDFRLIPAIAMQESNLCKKAPENSFNCWGFGIYGQKVTRFSDYEEGIAAVTQTLALKYKADGLDTPEEIMRRYTPRSNGSWADSVNYFMNLLR